MSPGFVTFRFCVRRSRGLDVGRTTHKSKSDVGGGKGLRVDWVSRRDTFKSKRVRLDVRVGTQSDVGVVSTPVDTLCLLPGIQGWVEDRDVERGTERGGRGSARQVTGRRVVCTLRVGLDMDPECIVLKDTGTSDGL